MAKVNSASAGFEPGFSAYPLPSLMLNISHSTCRYPRRPSGKALHRLCSLHSYSHYSQSTTISHAGGLHRVLTAAPKKTHPGMAYSNHNGRISSTELKHEESHMPHKPHPRIARSSHMGSPPKYEAGTLSIIHCPSLSQPDATTTSTSAWKNTPLCSLPPAHHATPTFRHMLHCPSGAGHGTKTRTSQQSQVPSWPPGNGGLLQRGFLSLARHEDSHLLDHHHEPEAPRSPPHASFEPTTLCPRRIVRGQAVPPDAASCGAHVVCSKQRCLLQQRGLHNQAGHHVGIQVG